jgi:uncharacterized iron-regulated membrane protein
MLTPRVHRTLRILHRWAGLSMAAFLVLVGLTGSALAFYWELDALLNPTQYIAPRSDIAPLDAGELATRARQRECRAYVTEIYFPQPGRVDIRVAGSMSVITGKPHALTFDEIALNPYTGEELGRRQWGSLREGWRNIMTFIYEFHYSLVLGDFGIWLLGIVALLWTLDSFTGLLITFPAHSAHRPARHTFWAQWKKAWKIRWKSSLWRINFDLHRAGSLWLWLALLIFAWSSVYMNLWDSVYTRVTATVMEFHPPWTELAGRNACATEPKLTALPFV